MVPTCCKSKSLPDAGVAVTVVTDGPSATSAVTTTTTAAAAARAVASGIATGLCILSVRVMKCERVDAYAYLCGGGPRGASGRQLEGNPY